MAGFYTGKLIKLPGFQLVEQFNFGNALFQTGTITQTSATYYPLTPTGAGITASNTNNAFFNTHGPGTSLVSFPKIYLYLNSNWTSSGGGGCCVEIRFQKDCDLIHWSSVNGWETIQYDTNIATKYKAVLEEHYFLYSLDREYIFYVNGNKLINKNIFQTYSYGASSISAYVHVIWKDKKTIQFWMQHATSSDYIIYKNYSPNTGTDNFRFAANAIFATPLEGYQYLTT